MPTANPYIQRLKRSNKAQGGMSTRHEALALYRSLVRASKQFGTYNFREYFLRRTRCVTRRPGPTAAGPPSASALAPPLPSLYVLAAERGAGQRAWALLIGSNGGGSCAAARFRRVLVRGAERCIVALCAACAGLCGEFVC